MAKPSRTARSRSTQGTTNETAAPDSTSDPRLVVLTIGHSTRSIETFIELLRTHGVKRLVDVRTIPRSKRNPQFNRDALARKLHSTRLHYTHLAALGGLRHARKDSVNLGWRNASFRGFADYMQTPEFEAGLGELMGIAREEQVTIMCAEAVPWRCHRSLIADALLVRGIAVRHIMSLTRAEPHHLTPFARMEDRRITYPLVLFSSEAAPSKY